MAVGMAMSFKHQRAVYDAVAAEGESIFDRHVWVLASDGDLQEGISYEAGALAGRHKLNNLTVIYDSNDIQIEGSTSLSWNEDVPARFLAQGWRVSVVDRGDDGDIDVDALDATLSAADDGRPHLVVLRSRVHGRLPIHGGGAPSPVAAGCIRSSGSTPLDELSYTLAPFEIDDDVLSRTRRASLPVGSSCMHCGTRSSPSGRLIIPNSRRFGRAREAGNCRGCGESRYHGSTSDRKCPPAIASEVRRPDVGRSPAGTRWRFGGPCRAPARTASRHPLACYEGVVPRTQHPLGVLPNMPWPQR